MKEHYTVAAKLQQQLDEALRINKLVPYRAMLPRQLTSVQSADRIRDLEQQNDDFERQLRQAQASLESLERMVGARAILTRRA